MVFVKCLLISALLVVGLREISGHGKMLEPVSRSSAWRMGYATPPNYDDNELYCGGGQKDGRKIAKECGVCGDPPEMRRPRPNENRGLYGTGLIVKSYKVGQTISVTIDVNANHAGHFYFALCPLANEYTVETEECFRQHPLKLADGSSRFKVPEGNRQMHMRLALPANVRCKHCVLRWHYRTGNSWGICNAEEDGFINRGGEGVDPYEEYGELGCGRQEVFRSCSDIAILTPTEYATVINEINHNNIVITEKLMAAAAALNEEYN